MEYQIGHKRKVLVLSACFYLLTFLTGQAQTLESLKAELEKLSALPGYSSDTTYLNLANELGFIVAESSPDSAVVFLEEQLQLCRKANYEKGEAIALKIYGNALQNMGDFKGSLAYYNDALKIAEGIEGQKLVPGILNNIGLVNYNLGQYAEALNNFFEAIKGADQTNDANVKAAALNNVALIYFEQDKLEEAKEKYREMLAIYQKIGNQGRIILAYNNIGDVELKQKNPTEALKNLKIAHQSAIELNSPEFVEMTSRTLADIYSELDSLAIAEELYQQSIAMSRENGYGVPYAHSLIGLAELNYKKGEQIQALALAKEGLTQAEKMAQPMQMRNAHELLSRIYEDEGNFKDALTSFQRFKFYNDSINTSHSQRITATLESEYEFSKKTLEYEKASLRQRWIIFSAFAGLIAFLIILLLGYRNKKHLDKAYHSLQEKTNEIASKNGELETTLKQLKSTQSQLIQSEKMASLGELTAGIAHEIQNPLNFVTNFSELSKEMVQEVEQERTKELPSQDQDLQNELLVDIRTNLDKIHHHSLRADAIVKGMLEHSRTTSGEKVPTDLNALASEYLRISFQGMRVKDQSFEVKFNSDLDPELPKVEVIPQNMAKVLMNIFNNAYYACGNPEYRKANPDLKPQVRLTTKKAGNNRVQLIISDNGPGIPDSIKEKIFQPFFTTKQTGEGTGLGLSLSYDIVKSHGGDLRVKSTEGEGTEMIIFLPIKS